eukprot:gene13737-15170_t
MKLIVKIINSCEFEIEGLGEASCVLDIKKKIAELKNISLENQRILFKGRSLTSDLKTLKQYGVENNSKIHVSVKKPHQTVTNNDVSQSLQQRKELDFWKYCRDILQKHFSPEDVDTILDEFTAHYKNLIGSLSLDDFERIAKHEIAKDKKIEI